VCKIYSRSEHNISRAQISDNALKVLYRLKTSGYQAYLVGGCVRDLLLGREPKDFDVVTNASPEQIKSVFRNCRLIGRRFRLAHICFGREIIEVATFRGADAEGDRVVENGRLLRDNIYGTIDEDVWRRDFTINALYYSIHDFSVVDYVNGMVDHSSGTLRLIGNPVQRYHEDPVRMLRAVRFATKLGFSIHPSCEAPIFDLSPLLKNIPPARLYDEVLKLFLSGYAVQAFEMLRHYHLFGSLFPETEQCLAHEVDGFPLVFLAKALENSDARIIQNKIVMPYFLIAAFLWEPVRKRIQVNLANGESESAATQNAAKDAIRVQVAHIAFPRRVGMSIKEVWNLQMRFKSRRGERPYKLLNHPRFRAAYDFLLLRAATGEVDSEIADWWTRFQDADESLRKTMTSGAKRKSRKRSTGGSVKRISH